MPFVARAGPMPVTKPTTGCAVERAGAHLDAADLALLEVEPLGEGAHLERHGTDEGEGPHGVRS